MGHLFVIAAAIAWSWELHGCTEETERAVRYASVEHIRQMPARLEACYGRRWKSGGRRRFETERTAAGCTERARMPRLGHPRPFCCDTLSWTGFRCSEPRGAKSFQVQVHGSRRVFGPLFPEPRGNFLALPGHGEACHDGCDGYETDTQGANTRLPRGGWQRRFGRGAAGT